MSSSDESSTSAMGTVPKWVLKKSAAKRFETGHPWVFSNEIDSVKGADKGDFIDLVNSSGRFLARGFANPASLISFRKLSDQRIDIDLNWLTTRILERRNLREKLGLRGSRRIVHGESGGLPGFIVDEFVAGTKVYWSIHIHSAGMDRMMNRYALKDFAANLSSVKGLTGIVVRRDSRSREMEGLSILEAEVWGEVPPECVISVDQGELINFRVNLLTGQKGGFFLDQRRNVAWLRDFLKFYSFEDSEPKILDAFAYCGQWGVGLGTALTGQGLKPQITFADSSESALQAAKDNALHYDLTSEIVKMDLVDGEWPWNQTFDVVVCDPPALIKSKKHYFAGRRAYLKVVLRGLKVLRPKGIFVVSSCSFHLSRYDLLETLLEAQNLLGVKLKILHDFSLPPDHLCVPEFPEGDYLKGFVVVLDT